MPSGAHNRRVKGKRITRAFIIGTEAWKLTDANRPAKIKPGDTTGWRVYVRPVPGGPDISAWLKKVVFVLHETFPNPVRNVESPPFELEETGYGGFFIVAKLYFQPYANEKWQQRQHFLQLEPYGDEATMAEQAKTGIVRSEIVEYIEFNEPTEGLWDALTSENQWDYLNPETAKASTGRGKGKGKGKGKGRASAPGSTAVDKSDRNVELPETGGVYSKETEKQLLDMLARAVKQCEEETAEVVKKSADVNAQLKKLKESQDLDAKLNEVHEKLPTKKR